MWATTVHRGRMTLIGGATDGSGSYQDVLSSADGVGWRLEPVREPWFVGRKYHAAASFGGQLYVTAGATNDATQFGGSRYLDDVWASKDGTAWRCVLPQAPWTPRLAHALVSYRGRLWLLGGEVASRECTTEVWSTTDGERWTQEVERCGWPGRLYGGSTVFRDRVWVMGGYEREPTAVNDVWTLDARPRRA